MPVKEQQKFFPHPVEQQIIFNNRLHKIWSNVHLQNKKHQSLKQIPLNGELLHNMLKKKSNMTFILMILCCNSSRSFLVYRIVSARGKSSSESGNRLCLTALIFSAGRHLNSIFNQQKAAHQWCTFEQTIELFKMNSMPVYRPIWNFLSM